MTDDKLLSIKRDFPDFARDVGAVVAGFSHLEYIVYIFFCIVSDDAPTDCFQKFYSLRSLNKKLELVNETIGDSFDENLKTAWKRLQSRLKTAAKKRTVVTHTQFLARSDGVHGLRRTSNGVETFLIGSDWFQPTFIQYRDLTFDLLVLLALLFEICQERHSLLDQLPSAPQNTLPEAPSMFKSQSTGAELDRVKDSLDRLGISLPSKCDL